MIAYDRNKLTNVQGASDLIPNAFHNESKPPVIEDLMQVNKRLMGGGMSQSYSGIYFFEYYIACYGFEYIVEIGFQKGALTLYFANLASVTERFYFDSFDISVKDYYNRPEEGVGHWLDRLKNISDFVMIWGNMDIFSPDAIDHISENIHEFKTMIFCDGGNKKKEFELYSRLIKPGDHIILHDWNMEVKPQDVTGIMQKNGIIYNQPWGDSCIRMGNLIMPLKKV